MNSEFQTPHPDPRVCYQTIMQSACITAMWSVVADRKFLEMHCTLKDMP